MSSHKPSRSQNYRVDVHTTDVMFSTPTHLRTRPRASSLMSISSTRSSKRSLDLIKATPTAVVTLLPGKHDAFGAFIPTASASACLRHITDSDPSSLPLYQRRGRRFNSLHSKEYDLLSDSANSSASSSALPSPTIPSISRTASTCYMSHPLSQSSSSSSIVLDASSFLQKRSSNNELDPILASLERKSKLCTRRVYCAHCKKPGTDYPQCGKCGQMWCSRECRLYGGKRHVCSK